MNIVLIGLRGSGKTTVGKILSQKLQRQFIDTDELLVKKYKKTIPEIVTESGWEYFRDIEEKLIKEVVKSKSIIISCGGGVVLRKINITNLSRNGKIFWLTATISTLVKRIGANANRPLLTAARTFKEDLINTLKARKILYQNAADKIINTENLTAKEVAELIRNYVESKQYIKYTRSGSGYIFS